MLASKKGWKGGLWLQQETLPWYTKWKAIEEDVQDQNSGLHMHVHTCTYTWHIYTHKCQQVDAHTCIPHIHTYANKQLGTVSKKEVKCIISQNQDQRVHQQGVGNHARSYCCSQNKGHSPYPRHCSWDQSSLTSILQLVGVISRFRSLGTLHVCLHSPFIIATTGPVMLLFSLPGLAANLWKPDPLSTNPQTLKSAAP